MTNGIVKINSDGTIMRKAGQGIISSGCTGPPSCIAAAGGCTASSINCTIDWTALNSEYLDTECWDQSSNVKVLGREGGICGYHYSELFFSLTLYCDATLGWVALWNTEDECFNFMGVDQNVIGQVNGAAITVVAGRPTGTVVVPLTSYSFGVAMASIGSVILVFS